MAQFPIVAPRSYYSLHLGQTTQGGHFDGAKTSFIEGTHNTLFQYKFAIILEVLAMITLPTIGQV
ncbi:hypothetical protein [Dyadobacter koreensis]|nr:hypothetical protein [Dyadobacter koreensis]